MGPRMRDQLDYAEPCGMGFTSDENNPLLPECHQGCISVMNNDIESGCKTFFHILKKNKCHYCMFMTLMWW